MISVAVMVVRTVVLLSMCWEGHSGDERRGAGGSGGIARSGGFSVGSDGGGRGYVVVVYLLRQSEVQDDNNRSSLSVFKSTTLGC